MSRIIPEMLRATTRPLTTLDVMAEVMRQRGLDLNDVALNRTMSKRVGACQRHWEKDRGAIKGVRGAGQMHMWEIVR